jgi:multidrug resistance efflux pump
MNTFWVHKNWKWKKENATEKYIDENCEEAVTLVDALAEIDREEAITLVAAQAEIDRLTLALERARRENEELQADARHEGLQYREFATEIAPANTALPDSGMISFSKLKEVIESALDAERELSAAWAEKARQYELELDGDPQNFHGQGRTTGLREQLTQLQALVRAAVERWRAQTNVEEGISFRMAMKELEATLDAMTPAGGQG